MSDTATTTIRAIFETREAAELAVEHLVQQHGISRPDVFVQSASDSNTTGTQASRGDVERSDAPHEGDIEVSADIRADLVSAVQRSFGDVGAIRVSGA
ncbi:hypothetical protein SAMN05880582_104114 [Rhizobium sp. RU20A]|uniref:hypothetical protein n=1 Tax=Rhizobium sp. RU20A TaxID=1907412 RepID=UPI0009547D2D|nr:hypothetical protein [Rhizobium sp. RU20A]SIQ86212.1 hypothetical protein SAMN05880582_104114 [Rhizobium sp. RU20A]